MLYAALALCPAIVSARTALPSDAVALARRFHEQPRAPGCVFYLTGGGMQLVPWLLTVPGASRTVLELQVPYSQRSLQQLIGSEPTQYVSADVARRLARQAYLRAQALTGSEASAGSGGGGGGGGGSARCLGLGCTAALRSEPPKRGEHRCFLAVHSDVGVWELELTLAKGLSRSRELEDEVVSRCALVGLAKECDLPLPTAEPSGFWQQQPSHEDAPAAASSEALEQLLRDERLNVQFRRHGF